MLSCLVWTRGLWVLISCVFVSCFAHGWWFVSWPCACVFVLCEHMASVLVFCVPCALMSIVLTPPILLPDYWLICPTCLSSLPSSFAPIIIVLCLQSCASSSSFHPGCILPCLVLSSLVLPSLCLVPVFPPRGNFCCCFCFILLIKAHLLHHWVLASSLHPHPWHFWFSPPCSSLLFATCLYILKLY